MTCVIVVYLKLKNQNDVTEELLETIYTMHPHPPTPPRPILPQATNIYTAVNFQSSFCLIPAANAFQIFWLLFLQKLCYSLIVTSLTSVER